MKKFTIGQALIYNPHLKSIKKKAIEIDMQQAKIMAYHPSSAEPEQKCNSVGMAEGVYQFCQSLLPQDSQGTRLQSILMDQCSLVLKEVEPDIWMFVKLNTNAQDPYRRGGGTSTDDQEQTYMRTSLTQHLCEQFITHFYMSFRTFYGKIGGYLSLERLSQLEKIFDTFVTRYSEINRAEDSDKMDISSYLLNDIRSVPLDVNSTLKFNYFNNVLQNLDPMISQLMIFANGYIAYTSLDKINTQFFANYLFSYGQPYKFEHQKLSRFKHVKLSDYQELGMLTPEDSYGTLFNSISYGFSESRNNPDRGTLTSSALRKSEDLLGLNEKQDICLTGVFLVIDGEERKLYMNCYLQKKMLFLTFYREPCNINQIIFQNRFFHDNSQKFTAKISQVFISILNQNENSKFLFCNRSSFSGKSTLKDWSSISQQVKYALSVVSKHPEGIVATAYQNYWIYGVRKLSRILVLMLPGDISLHKLDEFLSKMTKQYFTRIYM